jgi:hypothetical protein
MQDQQRSLQHNGEHAVSPSSRIQHILEHLEKLLRRPHEPSHDEFRHITEFIISLPEEYRAVGLTTIAEHFVNGMELHMLAIMATFQQRAEQEGISQEERQSTFNDILPQMFQTLAMLSKQISVKSLDELAALSNITVALYTLSRAETAQEAQKWLYELPTTYCRRLVQAGLLVEIQSHKRETENQPVASASNFVDWESYAHSQSHIVQEAAITNITIPTQAVSSLVPKPVSLEINKTIFMPAA